MLNLCCCKCEGILVIQMQTFCCILAGLYLDIKIPAMADGKCLLFWSLMQPLYTSYLAPCVTLF